MKHGKELTNPDPDCLPEYWADDPAMWSGLTMSMTEFLAWEQATEEVDKTFDAPPILG